MIHALFGEILAQHGLTARPRYLSHDGSFQVPEVIEAGLGRFIGVCGLEAVTAAAGTRGEAAALLSDWCDRNRHLAEDDAETDT